MYLDHFFTQPHDLVWFAVFILPTEPNKTTLVWFGSDYILKVNRIKPNRMFFYLAVWMIFGLKTEPNRTANTPKLDAVTFPTVLISAVG